VAERRTWDAVVCRDINGRIGKAVVRREARIPINGHRIKSPIVLVMTGRNRDSFRS
jgi:hypothetical protein